MSDPSYEYYRLDGLRAERDARNDPHGEIITHEDIVVWREEHRNRKEKEGTCSRETKQN